MFALLCEAIQEDISAKNLLKRFIIVQGTCMLIFFIKYDRIWLKKKFFFVFFLICYFIWNQISMLLNKSYIHNWIEIRRDI